ncbi:hypothetical protein [Rummeliibacillus stabekisii]|uniref:hypothetical protein n=1 Tax=Rummeliibacillus stabekisii TaxID=241244 RepID=UPI00371B9C36
MNTIYAPESVQKRRGKVKAGIRGKRVSSNPSKRKMSVDVSSSFEEIYDMNKKALEILSKRQ